MVAVLPPGVDGKLIVRGNDNGFEVGVVLAEDVAGAAGVEVGSDEEVAFEAGIAEEAAEGEGFVARGIDVQIEGLDLRGGAAAGDEPGEGGAGFVLAEEELVAAEPELGGVTQLEELAAFDGTVAGGVAAENENNVCFSGGLGLDEEGGGTGQQGGAGEPESQRDDGEGGQEFQAAQWLTILGGAVEVAHFTEALEHALDFGFVFLSEDGVTLNFGGGAVADGEDGLTFALGRAVEHGVGSAVADHVFEAAGGFEVAGEDEEDVAAAVDGEFHDEGSEPAGGLDVSDGTPGDEAIADGEFAVGEFDGRVEAEPEE